MSDAKKPIHSFVPVADEVPWWTEIENLKRELRSERALADRLADVFEFYFSEDGKIHIAGIKSRPATMEALYAWKEARSE